MWLAHSKIMFGSNFEALKSGHEKTVMTSTAIFMWSNNLGMSSPIAWWNLKWWMNHVMKRVEWQLLPLKLPFQITSPLSFITTMMQCFSLQQGEPERSGRGHPFESLHCHPSIARADSQGSSYLQPSLLELPIFPIPNQATHPLVSYWCIRLCMVAI